MNQMMKEDTSASLQTSVTRTGTTYQLPNVKKEDVQNVPLPVVYAIWGAARKLKENTAQLSTQAVANVAAAAEKAAADVAALERAAAEQTVDIDAVEQDAIIINADAEAGATVSNLHKEIKRLQAAADEATATINNLEAENKHLLLLLAAAKAAATANVEETAMASSSPVPVVNQVCV